MDEPKTFMVENAELIYKNFSGAEGPYNNSGERNFSVILDPDVADQMAKDGWAVKYPDPGEDDTGKKPYIKVKVGYKFRPPKVILITSTSRTNLTQETIGILDWADFEKVDLIAQSYYWNVAGKEGIAAYLKTMFATVQEDALERKYAIEEE